MVMVWCGVNWRIIHFSKASTLPRFILLFTLFFKLSWRWKASAAWNWVNSIPKPAATTFAFPSVWSLVYALNLCSQSKTCMYCKLYSVYRTKKEVLFCKRFDLNPCMYQIHIFLRVKVPFWIVLRKDLLCSSKHACFWLGILSWIVCKFNENIFSQILKSF